MRATFTGQEYDEENSLQYFGARYMDNEIGRFTAIDPVIVRVDSLEKILVNPQNLNSYAYGANNPVIFVDPDGNFSIRFDQLPVFKHYARWVNNNVAEASNIGVSVLPIVGDVQDLGEAISGKETFTGRDLSGGERTVAGVATFVPVVSGSVIRKGTKQVVKHSDEIKQVINSASNAYQNAVNNRGYSKFLQRYKDASLSELQKSIKSFDKVINEHIRKIDNPLTGSKNFNSLNNLEKNGLINKWKKDLFRNQSYKNILEKVLDKK